MNDAVLVAVGCLTGVLAGMLGAGGGFATVVLLLAAGADPHVTVGTSLVYLMVMGAWGTFVHLRSRTLDRDLVVSISISAAVFALLGAEVASRLSNRDLVLALGLFTACVSGVALAWPQTRRPLNEAGAGPSAAAAPDAVPTVPQERPAATPRQLVGAVMGGGLVGVLKGTFGVGAGFLIVPMMVSAARIPRSLAVGSSLLAILVGSLAGSLRHLTLGTIDGSTLLFLIPGGLFGSFVGARAAKSMAPVAIRRVFLAMMAASTIYLMTLAASFE